MDMSGPKEIVMDAVARAAIYDGQRVVLSPREAKLLTIFVDDQGLVLSRDEIVAEVWGGRVASPRAVDVTVCRLRSRLKRIGHPGIQTVFGRGYRLAA
jgi:DNA-binding winged helix-turn-helix (wHTH) protein